ncbi:EF-hand domain-containing protein [Pseudomonas sp. NPDC090203]|uniref:EF-hand domain-containing protein n=1 Tax=Pseudomonas sp. NPDC090203 TaxID=3364477 RepID=UPI00382E8585
MPISSVSSSPAVTIESVPTQNRTAVPPAVETTDTSASAQVRPSTIVTLSTDQKPESADPQSDVDASSAAVTTPSSKPDPADKAALVDEKKYPGLAAYARGGKGITLTQDELAEALRLDIIPEGHTKSAIPLSEAWAPQLFVRAGGGGGKLDVDQFSKQLAVVGVDAARAKSMFKDFDKSGDGTLSVDEYYEGIKAGGEKYTVLFQSLIDAYTRNADGSASEEKTNQFLAEGSAMATKFWSRRS